MFGYIRNGALGPVIEWKLKDCITVHKLLGTVLVDQNAALSKYRRLYIAYMMMHLNSLVSPEFLVVIESRVLVDNTF